MHKSIRNVFLYDKLYLKILQLIFKQKSKKIVTYKVEKFVVNKNHIGHKLSCKSL